MGGATTDIPTDLVYSSLDSCDMMNMKLASPKLLTADVVMKILTGQKVKQ